MVLKCSVRYGKPVAVEFAVLLLHLTLAEVVGEAQGQRIIDPEFLNEEEKVDAPQPRLKVLNRKGKNQTTTVLHCADEEACWSGVNC